MTNYFSFDPQKIYTYTVSEFNQLVDQILKKVKVAVIGEISGYKVIQKKWVSFDLKDDKSILPCFIPLFNLPIQLEDGMQIKVIGTPGIYTPYGRYTFRIQNIEAQGEGSLKKAFELTKKKLEKEGLFDKKYKKIPPAIPKKIGLITSRDAAAYSDVLQILSNRWKGLEILFSHANVQGEKAPRQICQSLEYFNKNQPVDLIILTRGGGSLEDLQAFNTETVARSVFASQIPIIAGIGHEKDTTLTCYTADVRASTPSHAAEIAVPDRQEMKSFLAGIRRELFFLIEKKLAQTEQTLEKYLQKHSNFIRYGNTLILRHYHALQNKILEIQNNIEQEKNYLKQKRQYFFSQIDRSLEKISEKILQYKNKLRLLSPKQILKKGYSITFNQEGEIIKNPSQVKKGEVMTTQLKTGEIKSTLLKE